MLGRVRLTGAEMEVAASSSEFSSGWARFLPLASRTGSLIVGADVAGYVARRALLVALESTATSFPFPFVVVGSRARFEAVEVEDCGCSIVVRSRSRSFSLAALTRALERSTLVSVDAVELDGSPG